MEKFFERFCDFCCAVNFLIGFCMFGTGEYTFGVILMLSFWAFVKKNNKIEKLEKEISHLNFLIEDKNKQILEFKNKENQ